MVVRDLRGVRHRLCLRRNRWIRDLYVGRGRFLWSRPLFDLCHPHRHHLRNHWYAGHLEVSLEYVTRSPAKLSPWLIDPFTLSSVLAEFIGGSWAPGNALAMMYFKSL